MLNARLILSIEPTHPNIHIKKWTKTTSSTRSKEARSKIKTFYHPPPPELERPSLLLHSKYSVPQATPPAWSTPSSPGIDQVSRCCSSICCWPTTKNSSPKSLRQAILRWLKESTVPSREGTSLNRTNFYFGIGNARRASVRGDELSIGNLEEIYELAPTQKHKQEWRRELTLYVYYACGPGRIEALITRKKKTPTTPWSSREHSCKQTVQDSEKETVCKSRRCNIFYKLSVSPTQYEFI